MSIAQPIVARRFQNIVANVAIAVDYPLYAETEVQVIYGLALNIAILNVDYTVTLNPNNNDFQDFRITPTLTLLTKINILIAAGGGETNQIFVRRDTSGLTTSTSALAKSTPFTSREFDRNAARDLEYRDGLKRAIVQSPATVEPYLPLYVKERLQLNETWKGDANGHLLRGPNVLTLEQRIAALENLAFSGGNAVQATTAEIVASGAKTQVKQLTPFNYNAAKWLIDGKISLQQMGAKGDFNIGTQVGTDNTQFFLDAIAQAQSLVASGQSAFAAIELGFGNFRVTQKLDFNYFNAWLYGVGKAATQIILDHSDYGIRMYRSLSHCKHMTIRSSTARNALAYSNTRPAFLHLGVTGAMQSSHCQYQDVTVLDNPGHGAVFVLSGSQIDFEAQNNKGHGIVVDTGKIFDGTALIAAPGDIQFQGFNQLENIRAFGNGGNGYVCGNPNDSASVTVYRTDIHDYDGFLNATDASVRVTDDDSYMAGVGCRSYNSGISPPNTKGGWTCAGRETEVHDHRVVGTGSYAGQFKVHANIGTFGGFFGIDTVVGPPAPLDPAIIIENGCTGIDVEARITSNITTLATPGKSSFARFGNTFDMRGGRVSADNFYSHFLGNVGDDKCLVVDFTVDFNGAAILWGETTFGRAALMHFGLGAGAFMNALPFVSGQVVGTTGVLNGTAGADGIVTVSAHTDGKLYIENRTGSTRTFSLLMMTLSAAIISSVVVVP